MLYFIGYIFKIIISLVVGFIIGHNFRAENEDNNKVVLYTSVLSFMTTSLSAVLINLNFTNSSVVIGFLLFGFAIPFISIGCGYIPPYDPRRKSRFMRRTASDSFIKELPCQSAACFLESGRNIYILNHSTTHWNPIG